MNTRAIAAQVVMRVRDQGAYSHIVLQHATTGLSPADRAFVYALVMEVLRKQRQVEAMINAASNRPLSGLDPEVRALLEVATAEMITDFRGLAYATVNEAVEAVRELGNSRAAPFVNAVLRKLATRPIAADGPEVRLSVPDWLLRVLRADHGDHEAVLLLAGLREPSPGVPLRIRPGGATPAGTSAVPGIADVHYAAEPPPAASDVAITDAATVAVGLAVAPEPGDRVLDMAAAPGGKTLHIWDQSGGDGQVVAMDLHRGRLRSARRRLSRLGAAPMWVLGDATAAPFRSGAFDVVLLDAPCTGLGTLRRRPEIAMRLEAQAPRVLGQRQQRMLGEAWRLTKRGGRIVYSVCTVFAAETVDVVDRYPARPPENLPGRPWGKGLLLAPHLTGTDAMFISVIER